MTLSVTACPSHLLILSLVTASLHPSGSPSIFPPSLGQCTPPSPAPRKEEEKTRILWSWEEQDSSRWLILAPTQWTLLLKVFGLQWWTTLAHLGVPGQGSVDPGARDCEDTGREQDSLAWQEDCTLRREE